MYIILGPRLKHAVLGQRRSRLLLCRAPLAHTHISTFGIYSSHGSRENVGAETQTDRPTTKLSLTRHSQYRLLEISVLLSEGLLSRYTLLLSQLYLQSHHPMQSVGDL